MCFPRQNINIRVVRHYRKIFANIIKIAYLKFFASIIDDDTELQNLHPILNLIYAIHIVLEKPKKVRRADYTDQEVGIVYSLKKSILRISIDGTLPYGFMSKYQSLNAKDGITSELIFEPAVTIYVRLRKSDVDIIESW